MKTYKKILLLLLGILIIAGTTYAWKAGGGVKWIGEIDQSSRFEDHSSDTTYGTGYYLDTYTGLKWQAHDTTPSNWNGTGHKPKWASGSTNSSDSNHYSKYPEPVWDGSNYIYNPPNGGLDTDYQAFKYCESIGDYYWRLPTKNELFSIVTDVNSQRNSSYKYTQLPSITQGNYWSSTANAYNSNGAWYVNFHSGYVGSYGKNITNRYTICVHD